MTHGPKNDGLNVDLMMPEDLVSTIMNRQHWIVVFGHAATDAIDALDRALAVYPTFPTVMCPGLYCITIIPKGRISAKRMMEAVSAVSGSEQTFNPHEQDIFMLASEDEAVSVALFVQGLVGGVQPC